MSIMKKVLSLALLLLPSQLITVEGFTTSVRAIPSAFTTVAAASSPSIQLHHHLGDNDIEHHHDYDTAIDKNNKNENNNDWNKKKKAFHKNVVNMAFVATMSVGILFSSTTMAPPAAFAADNSAVKDADIVDFSMPSYQDASRAAVNSNLKGDKFLLGDSNFEKLSIKATVVEEKTMSAADIKAEKEAAKAAMKAARAQQQADAEAAIVNKAKAAAAAAAAAAESPVGESSTADSPAVSAAESPAPAVTE